MGGTAAFNPSAARLAGAVRVQRVIFLHRVRNLNAAYGCNTRRTVAGVPGGGTASAKMPLISPRKGASGLLM